MTATSMVADLTDKEIAAQMQQWFSAGLPSGTFTYALKSRRVFLLLSTRRDVEVWAHAMGANALADSEYCAVHPEQKPVALRGFALDVCCPLAPVTAPIRIEVLA